MPLSKIEALAILRSNVGFDRPDEWVEFAMKRGFQRTRAVRLQTCEGCGSISGSVIGQYVYYSTLCRLVECRECGLIWSDVRLDDEVVRSHFERAYKDDEYFTRQRAAIFEQVARVVSEKTSYGGTVLDVGGATGILMSVIARIRPDLSLTVNDISRAACAEAQHRYGFAVRCGSLESLLDESTQYDTVICSDVLYYHPGMRSLWSTLARLTRPGGTLIVRVPNKWLAIRLSQIVRAGPKQVSISYFNPEHLYILRRSYIAQHLRDNGFGDVQALPSPLLARADASDWVTRVVFRLAVALHRLSAKRWIITPSMLVTARRA